MHDHTPSLRTHSLAILGQLRRVWVKFLKLALLLFPRGLNPASNKKSHELHPTAYLDALRGYAAWIVYNSHVIPGAWRPDTGPILSWPFFNILFKGPAMVDLFFVISGFALSYSALGHMYNNQPLRVLDSLASSVFRRHLRLYLPLVLASFVTMVAITAGIAFKTDDPPVLQPTVLANIVYWIKDTIRSCNPFLHVVSWYEKSVRVTHSDYIPQAWTIPVEFRGSMVVFLFCLAVCRMTTRARMWTTLAACFVCFWWVVSYAGLFLFGMWLADCRHQRTRQQQEGSVVLPLASEATPVDSSTEDLVLDEEKPAFVEQKAKPLEDWTSGLHGYLARQRLNELIFPKKSTESTFRQQLPFLVLFIFSFWPLTAPEQVDTAAAFPIPWLRMIAPPGFHHTRAASHWPSSVGAMMMCYAIDHSPLLQAPLKTPFSQFLGELSFGLYVMHNLVRWIVWDHGMRKWQKAHFGDGRIHQVPGYIVMTILILWAAEIFRKVDVKCVWLTKRLQKALWEH